MLGATEQQLRTLEPPRRVRRDEDLYGPRRARLAQRGLEKVDGAVDAAQLAFEAVERDALEVGLDVWIVAVDAVGALGLHRGVATAHVQPHEQGAVAAARWHAADVATAAAAGVAADAAAPGRS